MQHSKSPVDVEQIRSFPLFKPLDSEAADELTRRARARTVRKGELLLKRGEALDGLFTVLSGKLKIYLLSCNGAERIVRLLSPGDSFGEVIMFNEIASPVFVQGLVTSRLAYFPRESVYAMLASRPKFTIAMVKSLSHMLHEMISDLESCCMQNARQRLAHYLVCRAHDGAEPTEILQLPASKAIVASTLNLSAETFSRELHQLARDGLISIDRRKIRMHDVDKLKALAQQGDTNHAER